MGKTKKEKAKSILTILVISILSQLFVSCIHKNPVVGFILPHMTAKRYNVEKDVFIQRVKELGGEVVFTSADNDEEKQVEQVKDMLKKGIDILVLDPVNQFKAAEMVRLAHKKGIKVISYDRLVANSEVDAFLTFDANEIGNQMADYALSRRPSGKYFILGGDKSDLNAVLINEAIMKRLESSIKSGNVSVVYKTFIEKYSTFEAEQEVMKYLDLSMEKPDVILAANDLLSLGAIGALKKSCVTAKILITGQGGEVQSCNEILQGNQSMTIYKPVKKMASLAAEMAIKMVKGKTTSVLFKGSIFNGTKQVPSFLMGVITVDATNIESTLVADGLIAKIELNKPR